MGIALIGIDRKRFAVKGHDPYGMDPKGKQPEQAEAEPEYLSAAPYQIVPAVRRFKGCKGCGDILQGGKVLQLFPYYFYSGWEYRVDLPVRFRALNRATSKGVTIEVPRSVNPEPNLRTI